MPIAMPEIIAHRGASHAWPENTMAAFNAGLAEGADGLELDVQLSSDGVVMVFHDEHLGKLGERRARIADRTAAELQALDAGGWFSAQHAGLRVPTLDEVLTAFAGRTQLCVEIKLTEGAAVDRHRQLCEQVAAKLNGVDRVSLLSFHDEALAWAADAVPALHCVRNVGGPRELRRLSPGMAGIHALDIGINRFGLRHKARLQAPGLPLHAYTCDSRAQLRRALRLGATRLITNFPARSRERVQSLIDDVSPDGD
ncbi:MAG: hypothetical protein CMN28_03870 [Salinisphaeraceae bacterium]|nr:hypothetical protein [Salinisphaeraceae bacterium]